MIDANSAIQIIPNILLKLSYDDVLISPKKAIINSRKEISTKTKLTNKIGLQIPIVSANMDSVTESEMAISVARMGGIGIIHRFLTIEEQAEEVTKVKRADNLLVEFPYTVEVDKHLDDAKMIMEEKSVQGLIVIERAGTENKLKGIITRRDIIFQNGDNKTIRELMTSYDNLHKGWVGMSLNEAKEVFKKTKVEKLPIVGLLSSAPSKRFRTFAEINWIYYQSVGTKLLNYTSLYGFSKGATPIENISSQFNLSFGFQTSKFKFSYIMQNVLDSPNVMFNTMQPLTSFSFFEVEWMFEN